MKIYTRTGDKGQTGVLGGARVRKDSARIEAIGTVDELNAALGVANTTINDSEINSILTRIQSDLMILGADLATPHDAAHLISVGLPKVDNSIIDKLETEIDQFELETGSLAHFILPSGSHAGASLHLARCICRRAERSIASLQNEEEINPLVLTYLNRLSDHLFDLARLTNHRLGKAEIVWSRETVREDHNSGN